MVLNVQISKIHYFFPVTFINTLHVRLIQNSSLLFSLIFSFNNLRFIQHSLQASLFPSITCLLHARLSITISLNSSSHHLTKRPHTICFLPITSLATLLTTLSRTFKAFVALSTFKVNDFL